MKKLVVLLIAGCTFAGCAFSAQAWMWGIPNCAAWSYQAQVSREWVTGYLSGVASMDAMHPTALQVTTPPQAFMWIDNYCREHPLSTVEEAANYLYLELVKRQKQQQ